MSFCFTVKRFFLTSVYNNNTIIRYHPPWGQVFKGMQKTEEMSKVKTIKLMNSQQDIGVSYTDNTETVNRKWLYHLTENAKCLCPQVCVITAEV